MANAIPPMTHELSKHWRQPKDIREAPMDKTHVLLTKRQFDGLHEYSTSVPSGVYEGKCWKAETRNGWVLRWWSYGGPTSCRNNQRIIRIGKLKPRVLPSYPEH